MMLTRLIFTPLDTALRSMPMTSPGMPPGSTATVKSTWMLGSDFWSAASALARRSLAPLLPSVPPSMSKSSRLVPYVVASLRYTEVRVETLVHPVAISPPSAPPLETMTWPPAFCSERTWPTKAPRPFPPSSQMGVQPCGMMNARV